jgi:hypothetical protein
MLGMGSCLKLIRGCWKVWSLHINILVGRRHSQHLTFKNVLLSFVVSNNVNSNQRHITRSLGASRYFVKNAVVKQFHVDQNKENFWRGMFRKRWSDTLNEENKSLILNWWETTTTISPITKDVKKRRIAINTFKSHPTHYLQESQVRIYQLSI